MSKLVIWGASGHARVVADIAGMNDNHEVVGFIDDTAAAGGRFLGLPVFHDLEIVLALQREGVTNMIVAVGDCRVRLRLAETAERQNFALVTAIHPRAVVARDAAIGRGTVLAASAVLNPGCTVGANVIINTGATVDHDCHVADGSHIGPGAHLGGAVSVGRGTWIGIGAIVRDHVSIGSGSIIGAGAVVLSNIPANTVAYGIPAKPIKEVQL